MSFAGLVVFAAGFNIRAPMLAVMSEYIDPSKEAAQLYTLISLTDALAHMIGSPGFEYVWGHAVKIGGAWLVLQFLVLTVRDVNQAHCSKLMRVTAMLHASYDFNSASTNEFGGKPGRQWE